MGELPVSILRLSYLLVLWVFVFAAISVLRRDVYGTKIIPRSGASSARRPGRARRKDTPGPIAIPTSDQRGDAPTRIVVKSGPLRGTTLPLTSSGVVIGRSSAANLVLDDDFASGRHAQLVPHGSGWFVEDLGSTNGTFVGHSRVTAPVAVYPGDTLRIGNTTLEVLR